MYGKKVKLKILIVTQYFWPENFRINDLALYFAKKGHQVIVLTGLPNYPEGEIFLKFKKNKKKYLKLKNIKIIRVPIIPRKKNIFFLFLNYLTFSISSIFFSIWKLKNKNFDIVFTCQYSPVFVALTSILLCKIKKIKHLIWVQDLWPETLLDLKVLKKGIIYSILKKIVNFIFKNSDIIFVQSKEFIKIIEKNYKLKNIKYLPNWCEDIFINNKKKFPFKKSKKQFNIVFTGNVGKAQDFNNIIKAANYLKKYSNFYWHIFGGGSDLELSKQNIKTLKLEKNFIFYDRKSLDLMPSVLSAADILVITMMKSSYLKKTIPGKLQAYLTAKKPIVGMIDGITNNIINQNKLGLAAAAGDYKNFAKNIVRMYKLKEKKNMYKNNTYKYYNKNFNKEKNLSFLEKIILDKHYDKFKLSS